MCPDGQTVGGILKFAKTGEAIDEKLWKHAIVGVRRARTEEVENDTNIIPTNKKRSAMRRFTILILFFLILLMPAFLHAQNQSTIPAQKIDAGDTAWLLFSTALVMLMTPGLALFYGGMVRRKNVLGTIMQSFIALGVISVQWVLFGYSLAFGPDIGHLIGGLQWAGLRGVGLEPIPIMPPQFPIKRS